MGRNKGNSGSMVAQNLAQALENDFAELANKLMETLMTWDATSQQLEQEWRQVMTLRSRCLQAYKENAAKSAGPAGPAGPAGQISWKGELHIAYGKHFKKSVEKDELHYETQEAEGGGYISSLTSAGLQQQYQSWKPAQTKKEAESLAAQAAMIAEFPDYYQIICDSSSGAAMAQHAAPVQGQGQKRKAAEMQAEKAPESNARTELAHAAQLLKGETLTKGDIVYEVAEVNGKSVATVRLPAHDPSASYHGLPKDSKKDAELNAAQVALRQLQNILAPLQEAQKAKKMQKNKETLGKLKERTAQKKAAGTLGM